MSFYEFAQNMLEEKEVLVHRVAEIINNYPHKKPNLDYNKIKEMLADMSFSELEKLATEYQEKTEKLQASHLEQNKNDIKQSSQSGCFRKTITMFHGSDCEIDQVDFLKSSHFGFHVGTKSQAEEFGDKIHKVTFGYNKLLEMEDLGTWAVNLLTRELLNQKVITHHIAEKIHQTSCTAEQDELIRQCIIDAGFDGIKYTNLVECEGEESVILIRNDQIMDISIERQQPTINTKPKY